MQKELIRPASDAGGRNELVRDRIWVLAQIAGAYNDGPYLKSLPKKSAIEPAAAAEYMGISNTLFITFDGQPAPPFDDYYKQFANMDKMAWSLTSSGGATSPQERQAAIELAEKNPNMVGFVLDDFFCGGPAVPPPVQRQAQATSVDSTCTPDNLPVDENDVPIPAVFSPQQLAEIREKLVIGGRRLSLVAVMYTENLSQRAVHHLRHVDGVQLWTWQPQELKNLERNLARLEKILTGAPPTRIYLGCYMYDFWLREPMPLELMKMQAELGLKWLKKGRIEGIVFVGTPICDLNLEAVEWTREWIARVGDEKLTGVRR